MSRPPGRPPLDPTDRSVPVQLTLSAKQLAAAKTQADQYRQTVQDWLRTLVTAELKRNK